MFKKRIQKIIALFASVTVIALAYIPFSKAEDSIYLPLIYKNTSDLVSITNNVLVAVNKIPELLQPLTALALGWLTPDTSEETAALQGIFVNLNSAYLTNTQTTFDVQKQLLGDFFGSPLSIDYANDLSYSTLWGKLYTEETRKNVDPAYNYVKNASGLNISHTIPRGAPQWKGSQQDIDRYQNYYQTIAAVQTFNTFVLSQAYANQKNGYNFTTAQLNLIQQASDAKKWFAIVASEQIGIVLRQILMYDSQIYLTLTQLLQTQQQLLAAQTMTNTLLIIGNQFTETQLLGKATGRPQI